MSVNKHRREVYIILILLVVLAGLFFTYHFYSKENLEIQEFSIFCDFENQNDSTEFLTNNEDYILGKGSVSEKIFYEGEKSLYIPKWKVYQNLLVLDNLKPNSIVTISFKRFHTSDASIVAQGIDPASFYFINGEETQTYENGWEDVYLKFTCGQNFKDTLKIYIFNSGKQDTYIDNLSISVSGQTFYPNYENEEPILIYIEDKEFRKIQEKRDEALYKGVLITEDDSWVNAIIYGDEKMMHAQIRLKGDWLDHLRGEKWSFRIKLKDDSWRGMRVFSIQNPSVRGFLNEWLIHKTCKDIDILTTRYGFVPVYLNGKPIGMYSYEEHFQKELVESSKRREGPIIKYSEEDFWDFMLSKTPNGFTYVTSVIEPFGSGSILKDSVKYQQFIIAQNLLESYRLMQADASDIFDVKKMAKFIAFVNSRNAFHSLQWHNVRYYYNPVLCRLEPIAFDMFAGNNEFSFENPISPMLLAESYFKPTYCLSHLMTDSIFEKEYFKYLDLFTNDLDYESFRSKYNEEYQYWDSLNKLEFIPYYFDTIQFQEVLDKIDTYLPIFKDSLEKHEYRQRYHELKNKPFFVAGMQKPLEFANKYLKVYKQSENKLLFKCFLQYDIDLIGLGDEDEIISEISETINNKNSGIVKIIEFNFTENMSDYSHVYFKVREKDSIFTTKIVQWPAPTNYNPRNDIAANSTDISEYTNEKNKQITFKGNLKFNNHIYIPAGYVVSFEPGTKMDITNGAAFISSSTIKINGTQNNPVKIFSSDMSANGFTILQADGLSTCKYAIFDNFNTLDYNGWTITGAVTFYESDVEFYNCTFNNNHCEDMLNTVRCNFLLKDCSLNNTYGDSHDSDFCTGTLDNCLFTNNGNDAIDFSTSEVTIKNCTINGAKDKGISVGENTKAKIYNVVITDVNIGIASKDLSHAEVEGCKISKATYGFLLLQKKPEFGPATITANNCTLDDVWTESLIEKNSTLTLNGKTIKGKKHKLKALFYE